MYEAELGADTAAINTKREKCRVSGDHSLEIEPWKFERRILSLDQGEGGWRDTRAIKNGDVGCFGGDFLCQGGKKLAKHATEPWRRFLRTQSRLSAPQQCFGENFTARDVRLSLNKSNESDFWLS